MSNETHLLGIRLQMEALITSREGMIALNQERANKGQTQAYTEDAFDDLRKSFEALRMQL